MIYQYIIPSPPLQEFIRNYLIAHFIFNKDQNIPFKPYSPKPEQTITFLPKGNLTVIDPQFGQKQVAPLTSICGQQLSRYDFYLSQEYQMLRVHFQPGALYRLLGIPLLEFTDCWFDATSVINFEIMEVNEQLAHCQSYSQMIAVVEVYLIKKLKKVVIDFHPLDKVAACLFTNPSRFSLDWLANQTCLCPRQFNRKFTERMGVGPKLYSRVVRFHKAYQYKEMHPKEDWLSIALLFGYNDYQHMVKDFKEFAGVTPNLWVDQDNHSPERILQLE
ncbi:AraC family transcriptional regulator [Algoriphagus sp. D3-2-R+10]|uniref:AraC family transcriptional regulator n=1 Tax=Algoriphagus aurantiacus TaxID=3103948 RepID=UPI002B395649|nr:AraC family transcriptional regulator [Algoriphagus sp. D3-2-R+10]MEB2778358.1 AraC family transcriptional regulator [Algoriphagus sp. D3-2-R+10]